LHAERDALSSPGDELASGLEFAAIAADDLGTPVFRKAPVPAQRKMVSRIARRARRERSARTQSAIATVLLDVFEGGRDARLRDEAMTAYLALLARVRVPQLRESMTANLDRVSRKLDRAEKIALDRAWDAILPHAPPYAAWFGGDGQGDGTLRVVCQVQDVFFEAWRHQMRRLGFRSDGSATRTRIRYTREDRVGDRTTTIVVDYVDKAQGIFQPMHDPKVDAVIFCGHSDWWARVPRNLAIAPDQVGEKLLVVIMCFGKHFYHSMHARYPRAHIVTTKDPTEDPEDEAVLRHLFAGISARKTWTAIRRDADADRTTDDNFIFPGDWRYVAGVTDDDRDGRLDRFDRFCNLAAKKILAPARSFEQAFEPDPPGLHPRGAELHPRELDGGPVLEAALMLNSLSYDNRWLDEINSQQRVACGGWHQAAPGDFACARLDRAGEIVRLTCSTRYARAPQPALTALVVYEGWSWFATSLPKAKQPSPLDRALMGVLLVAHALGNADYPRPDEWFHAWIRRRGFPAGFAWDDAYKLVEFDEDWESGSPKSFARYKRALPPRTLERLAQLVGP
jgi:hypothetical protein